MTYLRHAITSPSQLLEEEKAPALSYDRKEMIWELKIFAQTLLNSGVNKIFQFSRQLKDFGFDSKDTRNLINYLMPTLSPGNLPSQRTLYKANFSEKNLILTYLALKSEKEIMTKLLWTFLSQFKQNLQRKEELINSLISINNEVLQLASDYKKINNKIDLKSQNLNTIQLNEDSMSESSPEMSSPTQTKYTRLPGIENFAFAYNLY